MRYPFIFLTILLTLTIETKANSEDILEYYGNDHFNLSENAGYLVADIDKLPFESFSLKVDNLQLCKTSICNLKIKSSSSIFVKIDLTNGTEVIPNVSKTFIHIEEANTITDIKLDFTSLYKDLKSDDDLFLIVYIEPGSPFKGTVELGQFSFENTNSNVNTGLLEAYYSPSDQSIIMQIPEGERLLQLNVYSINGKLIKSQTQDFSTSKNYTLQLEQLRRGIYIIALQSRSNLYSSKILIP